MNATMALPPCPTRAPRLATLLTIPSPQGAAAPPPPPSTTWWPTWCTRARQGRACTACTSTARCGAPARPLPLPALRCMQYPQGGARSVDWHSSQSLPCPCPWVPGSGRPPLSAPPPPAFRFQAAHAPPRRTTPSARAPAPPPPGGGHLVRGAGPAGDRGAAPDGGAVGDVPAGLRAQGARVAGAPRPRLRRAPAAARQGKMKDGAGQRWGAPPAASRMPRQNDSISCKQPGRCACRLRSAVTCQDKEC